MCLQVKQARTAARYEKMVLRANEWMVEQGYAAFCEVVEESETRYTVKLLAVDGVPQVPSLEAVIEFMIGFTTGEVEKGGSRVAREKDWYASPCWGKSQAEMCMPLAKKGKFGWGPHKNLPFRLGIIEQHVSALRQWLQEQLRRFDVPVANPLHDGWVDLAMTRELGRGRMEDKLPPILEDAVLREVLAHADMKRSKELQMVSYIGKNCVHGSRAHDNEWLDRGDSTKQTANAEEGRHGGRKIKHRSTKNNKEGQDRPKGLQCRSSCCGMIQLTLDGGLDGDKMCPACMLDVADKDMDDKLGASSAVTKDLPQFADAKMFDELCPGSNLVRCEPADQKGTPPELVCVLSREEHERGVRYDGSVPFCVDGKERRPRPAGTWFEVPNTGSAIRVWASAHGVTQRLRAQLKLTNHRAGKDVVDPALIANGKEKRHDCNKVL